MAIPKIEIGPLRRGQINVITGLVRSDGTVVSETLNVQGTASVVAAGTTNNADVTVYSQTSAAGDTATAFKSVVIANGIATFHNNDTPGGGTAITVTTKNLAGAIAVLQSLDIGDAGATVAFKIADVDGSSSADELMVFTQGSSTGADDSLDTLVMLKDQGAVDALIITTNTAGANDFFIA